MPCSGVSPHPVPNDCRLQARDPDRILILYVVCCSRSQTARLQCSSQSFTSHSLSTKPYARPRAQAIRKVVRRQVSQRTLQTLRSRVKDAAGDVKVSLTPNG